MNTVTDPAAPRLLGSLWSRKRRARWRTLALLAFAGLASTGCSSFPGQSSYSGYSPAFDDMALGWRNRVWSRQAWYAHEASRSCHPQSTAFGEGFRDGYTNVANGGTGCLPPLPPPKFWGWRYQSPEGQAKVAAWYEGFPLGVQAAREEGIPTYGNIQVSNFVDAQYSAEFRAGECPTCAPSQPYSDQLPPGAVPIEAPPPAHLQLKDPVVPEVPQSRRPTPPPDTRASYGAGLPVSPVHYVEPPRGNSTENWHLWVR